MPGMATHTFAAPTPVHWDDHGASQASPPVDQSTSSPGGGPTPSQNYHRYLGDKVGQLWPRRSLEVQEVDMGYIFRGVAQPVTIAHEEQKLLTIDLSAGDSDAFSGSGTTAITYSGPPMSMLLTGQARFAAASLGARRIGLMHNGSEVVFQRVNPDVTSTFTGSVAWPIVVSDGDTFGMRVYQNSQEPLQVTEGQLRGVIVGEWQ